MCLDRVTGKPKRTSGYGWKVVRRALTPDTFRYVCCGSDDPRPRNEWLEATDEARPDLDGDWEEPHPVGFYLFKTRAGAEKWFLTTGRPILKARYRGAHTEGFIKGAGVIVAREMMVL